MSEVFAVFFIFVVMCLDLFAPSQLGALFCVNASRLESVKEWDAMECVGSKGAGGMLEVSGTNRPSYKAAEESVGVTHRGGSNYASRWGRLSCRAGMETTGMQNMLPFLHCAV